MDDWPELTPEQKAEVKSRVNARMAKIREEFGDIEYPPREPNERGAAKTCRHHWNADEDLRALLGTATSLAGELVAGSRCRCALAAKTPCVVCRYREARIAAEPALPALLARYDEQREISRTLDKMLRYIAFVTTGDEMGDAQLGVDEMKTRIDALEAFRHNIAPKPHRPPPPAEEPPAPRLYPAADDGGRFPATQESVNEALDSAAKDVQPVVDRVRNADTGEADRIRFKSEERGA